MKEKLTKLTVQVQPNARRNELVEINQGILKIKIAAPPSKGKANQELISYLSDILGIAKNRIIIQRGNTGRRKLIRIEGINQDQIMAVITGFLNENKPYSVDG